MWIVPSEFSKALEGLSRLTGADGNEGGDAPSWLNAQSSVVAPSGGDAPIDTSEWFDSNLTPAAEQPEAQNLRASDTDPESLAAQMPEPRLTFGKDGPEDSGDTGSGTGGPSGSPLPPGPQ
jgi:hypothetical protein